MDRSCASIRTSTAARGAGGRGGCEDAESREEDRAARLIGGGCRRSSNRLTCRVCRSDDPGHGRDGLARSKLHPGQGHMTNDESMKPCGSGNEEKSTHLRCSLAHGTALGVER